MIPTLRQLFGRFGKRVQTRHDAEIQERRALTSEERDLSRWMLEHGTPEARGYLDQLDNAVVVSRCRCGCASVNFEIQGRPHPTGGLRTLADFTYGEGIETCGVFIFEQEGTLSGLEVWSVDGDAPRTLPNTEKLQPFQEGS